MKMYVHNYIDADGCRTADDDKKTVGQDVDMNEERSSITDGFSPNEDVNSAAKINHVNVQGPQESSTPASATKTSPVHAVVDKCKKVGAQWKEDNGYTVAFIHLCTIPMMGEMSDSCWKGVVASGGLEEREQYEDTVDIRYEALETKGAHGIWALTADML